ncbi:MAG TPA: response regulator transcription factor [Myxococcaceae bacterium]|nr:response regulator transcription factor [Myxococcaceae bacterium]
MPPDRRHVLLVSADPLARAGLRAVLAAAGWEVAAEASSLTAARAALREARVDAVLWDAGHAPVPDAPEPGAPPVLALVEDESAARAVLAAGLSGAVLRGSDQGTLAAALAAASRGLVVSDQAFVHLRPQPEVRPEARSADFTRRELEVLALLAEGLPNRAIADRLGISRHTVKFHVNALLQKLGVERRTEAVVRAARLGLVVL